MLAVWKYYKVYEFERLTAENENKKKAEKRLLTQATIESTRAYNRDSKKAKDITGKVMEFIGLDDQPLRVVEDMGVRRLLSHSLPLHFPRSHIFCRCIPTRALPGSVFTRP